MTKHRDQEHREHGSVAQVTTRVAGNNSPRLPGVTTKRLLSIARQYASSCVQEELAGAQDNMAAVRRHAERGEAAWKELTSELTGLVNELESAREVADPDNETPELSLRDRVMHIGEQAALLVSANRMIEKARAERDAYRAVLADLLAAWNRARELLKSGTDAP